MSSKRPPNSEQTTPSGIRIRFWDSIGVDGEKQQRRYIADPPGEREPSVTTVTSIYDKSRQFVRKALSLAEQGIDWYTYTDEAAVRGVAAHDLIVRMMAEGRQGRLSELDEAHRPWGQAAARWLLDRSPKLVLAERMVAGPGFVGRFDLLCELDGALTLVDFKSATARPVKYKDGKIVGLYPPYPEVALQLAAYALACKHSGYPEPENLAVVRLFPDGTYDETPVPNKPERFLAALGAYRAKLDTERDLRAVAA